MSDELSPIGYLYEENDDEAIPVYVEQTQTEQGDPCISISFSGEGGEGEVMELLLYKQDNFYYMDVTTQDCDTILLSLTGDPMTVPVEDAELSDMEDRLLEIENLVISVAEETAVAQLKVGEVLGSIDEDTREIIKSVNFLYLIVVLLMAGVFLIGVFK